MSPWPSPGRPAVGRPSSWTASSTAASAYREDDVGARAPRVLQHVGERLLDDPVQRDVDARGQLAGASPATRSVARERRPRGPWPSELRQLGDAGLGHERVRAPRRAAGRACARSSATACCPVCWTARSGWRAPLGVAVEQVLGGAGLDHHDADAVRDHVVQLAGDPGALGGDRVLDPRGPLVGQPAACRDSAAWLRSRRRRPRPTAVTTASGTNANGTFAAVPMLGHPEEQDDERGHRDEQPGRRTLAVGMPRHRVGGHEHRQEVAPQRDGQDGDQLRPGDRRGDDQHRRERGTPPEGERPGGDERAEDDGPLRTEPRRVVQVEAQIELGEGGERGRQGDVRQQGRRGEGWPAGGATSSGVLATGRITAMPGP